MRFALRLMSTIVTIVIGANGASLEATSADALATTPSWTGAIAGRVLNIVSNAKPVSEKSFAATHRQAALDPKSLGVEWSDDERALRFSLTRALLEKKPSDFDVSKLFPIASAQPKKFNPLAGMPVFMAVLGHLYSERELAKLYDLAEICRHDARGYVLDLFLGNSIFAERGMEGITVAANHGERFLKWFEKDCLGPEKNHKASLTFILTSAFKPLLAGANAIVAGFLMKNPARLGEVEGRLLKIWKFSPDKVSALNIANWYRAKARKDKEREWVQIAAGLPDCPDSTIADDVLFRRLPGKELFPVAKNIVAGTAAPEAAAPDSAFFEKPGADLRALENDPVFMAAENKSLANLCKGLSAEEFAASPLKRKIFASEILAANLWETPEEKLAALRRIVERSNFIEPDEELFGSMAKIFGEFKLGEYSGLLAELRAVLKAKIIELSLKRPLCENFFKRTLVFGSEIPRPARRLVVAVASVPGLVEELAYEIPDLAGLPIALDSAAPKPRYVIPGTLHKNLLAEWGRLGGMTRDVLRILSANGVTSESALYRYWSGALQNARENERSPLSEEARARLAKSAEFWREAPPQPSLPARTRRTGAARHHAEVTAPTPHEPPRRVGYDSAATLAEAARAANAIPPEIRPFLELWSETASGGSMSIVTLVFASPDGAKIELAKIHPHREHSASWEKDKEELMALLWNAHKARTERD